MSADAARFEVALGLCARPVRGESACGDACDAVVWSRGSLLAIADGLGHGPQAALAARTFMACVREAAELELDQIFARAHRELLKTRGAVAAIARFERGRDEAWVAGLGNINIAVIRSGRSSPERPVLVPGVVGSAFRAVRPQPVRFGAGDIMVMHTDGVRQRFDAGPLTQMSAQQVAERMVRDHGKDSDDAGCAVAVGVLGASEARARVASGALAQQQVRELPIRARSDAECAARDARAFAEALGFAVRAQWEVSIATSELATNMFKHAGGGVIKLDFDAPQAALVVEAVDKGKGIGDVQAALADGFSRGGRLKPDRERIEGEGFGVGLGSIQRMMDDVTIESGPGGTRVIARKLLGRS